MSTRPTAARARSKKRPRVSMRTRQKAATRQRILNAAAEIARHEGLQAASIPRVMGAAGLTIGGFYGHFPSKLAMDAEVIRTIFEPISSGALAGIRQFQGIEWLSRAVRNYLSPANRDHPHGCPYPTIMSEVAIAPPELRRAFTDALKLRIGAYESRSPRLPGVTPRQRAIAASALTIGGLLLARATVGDPLSDEILAACAQWALPEFDVEERGAND